MIYTFLFFFLFLLFYAEPVWCGQSSIVPFAVDSGDERDDAGIGETDREGTWEGAAEVAADSSPDIRTECG